MLAAVTPEKGVFVSHVARRGVAVTAVASVLASVALLVPQIAGALNLTTLGKVLSVLAVGFLTASAQRLAKGVKDRQTVKSALRVWPPEPLQSARLETLGVFPARDSAGQILEYRPRPADEDQALFDAFAGRIHQARDLDRGNDPHRVLAAAARIWRLAQTRPHVRSQNRHMLSI